MGGIDGSEEQGINGVGSIDCITGAVFVRLGKIVVWVSIFTIHAGRLSIPRTPAEEEEETNDSSVDVIIHAGRLSIPLPG